MHRERLIYKPSSEFEPDFKQERQVEVGETLVGYLGVGTPRLLPANEGFNQAYSFSHDYDLFSEQAHENNIELVVAIARKAMMQKGWNGVDRLVVASISSRISIPHEAAGRLRTAGYGVGQSLQYSFACDGGMAAALDASLEPEMKNKRVLVIATEFLSGNVLNPSPKPEHQALRDMFGNGAAYMAFEAGKDIEVLHARTVVSHDAKGVIKIPSANDFPDIDQRIAPPEYYQFANEKEHQTITWSEKDDRPVDYFLWTKEGAYVRNVPSPSGYTEMLPLDTLNLFANEGARFIVEDEAVFNQYLRDEYGQPTQFWGHQPSKTVVGALGRKVLLTALQAQGVEKGEATKISRMTDLSERATLLASHGVNDIRLPWVMNSALVNNVSGATSFVQLVEATRMGLIQPEAITRAHGFAIGAIFTNAYVIFH